MRRTTTLSLGTLLLAALLALVATQCALENGESGAGSTTQDLNALSVPTVLTLAHSAGLPCSQLVTSVAIALAESGLRPDAVNHNSNGSTDRGLWQINSIHPYSVSCTFDPACNAGAMYAISGGGSNWHPWSTYNAGLHVRFLPAVQAAYAASAIPGCTAFCPHGDGNYCGGHGIGGNAGTLYHCVNGEIAPAQACDNGCEDNGGGSADRCTVIPHGALDAVACDSIHGWAQDPNTPTQAEPVDLYIDGPAGSGAHAIRVTADESRADLCTALGSCNHGFTLATPPALRDGRAHTIYAYGISTVHGPVNPALAGAPRTLRCAATRVGDFNGDGRADVVQYRGDWQSAPVCASTVSGWSCRNLASDTNAGAGEGSAIVDGSVALVADLDHDGRADLLQYNDHDAALPACLSLGVGWSCRGLAASFDGGDAPGNSGSGVYAGSTPLTGDFNGDGHPDVIQFDDSRSSIPVCVWLGSGWSCRDLAATASDGDTSGNAGSGVHRGATPLVGDFNGDGRADLAQFDPAGSTIALCLSLGSGWSCRNATAGFVGGAAGGGNAGSAVFANSTPLVGDFDGDGRMDLAQYDPTSNALPVCSWAGSAWLCRNEPAALMNATDVGMGTALVGDFNGDGRADIAQYNNAWSFIPLCLSTGTGWSCRALEATYDGGARGPGNGGGAVYPGGVPLVGDFNGDGRADIAQYGETWQSMPVCLSLGSAWSCRDLHADYAGGIGAGNEGSGIY